MSADPTRRRFRYENYEINADTLFRSLPKEGKDETIEDSELTWLDIKRIVNIAEDMLPGIDTADILSEFQTEEAYYKEILKRYNETRK